MNELAWSDGTKPERSFKKDKQDKQDKQDKNQLNTRNLALSPEWQVPETTKREEAIGKINERELIGRMGQNPFLTDSTYSQDIEVQQNFLMPQNSNNSK
jgi:hypothetical protein